MPHHSWDMGDKFIHRMLDKAKENYKAHENEPHVASLHTIAYMLALQELRSWRMHQRLDRIASK